VRANNVTSDASIRRIGSQKKESVEKHGDSDSGDVAMLKRSVNKMMASSTSSTWSTTAQLSTQRSALETACLDAIEPVPTLKFLSGVYNPVVVRKEWKTYTGLI
jgi:hypothetical protein